MAQVKVLIEGYTSAESEEESTCPTMALVQDGDIVMVRSRDHEKPKTFN